ncbi:MAG: glycosyltransferase [Candidatus Scalinduaceae bacterium]
MKIFIGLTDVAGYYTNLKKGFDELGVKSVFVNLGGHPFEYGGDDTQNILIKLRKSVTAKLASTHRSSIFLKVLWRALRQILWTVLFAWAILRYDVFIFGYKSSFLSFYDLPILKFFKKKVIYIFHGSDSRPPYIDGSIMSMNGGLTVEDCINLTRKQKNTLKRIERYADIIIGNPLSSHLHEKPVIVVQIIGIPFKCDKDNRINAEFRHNHGIRILHSPSNPEGKGTSRIRKAIKSLQAKGHPLEFVEITGKSNTIVLNELANCDFVIDQLYSDTPMAGLATEAAFFGNPTIVGGYGQAEIRRIFPADKMPLVFFCHPDEIEKAIEKLIMDEKYRMELGRKVKQFVETNWAPKKVARRYLQLIKGNIPEDWLYDPKDISYLNGCGLPEYRSKELIKSVIERGGKEALQLSDKPDLERMFVEFARGDGS